MSRSTTLSTGDAARRIVPATAFDRAMRGAVLRTVSELRHGTLEIREGGETSVFEGSEPGPRARIDVHDGGFWATTALRGSIGAAEAYIDQQWSSPDLTDVVRLMVRNRAVLEGLEKGLARLAVPPLRWYHSLRSNTRRGSKKNIAAHYDLGNEFFSLWLDESMTYSSAIFDNGATTLEEAQTEKLDRLCRNLDVGPDDHLLEIGTGWGSFALHAASRYGCRVTTTTISGEQHRLANERVLAAGLTDRVTVLQRDYRDLTGRYDKIVSIEMIEAVGHKFYDTFFESCARLLKPDGLMGMQAIVIRDSLFESAKNAVDFIQRHVFPGSCIPSVGALSDAVSRSSDLRMTHLEDITAHYARTLAEWRTRFTAQRDSVLAQGFPESFLRLWEYYLCYCEGGFAERQIGTVQMVWEKPLARVE
jgi:cyclopropane-fatty-acyl-phospholipid synthase